VRHSEEERNDDEESRKLYVSWILHYVQDDKFDADNPSVLSKQSKLRTAPLTGSKITSL
jgi:hypothetical protein